MNGPTPPGWVTEPSEMGEPSPQSIAAVKSPATALGSLSRNVASSTLESGLPSIAAIGPLGAGAPA